MGEGAGRGWGDAAVGWGPLFSWRGLLFHIPGGDCFHTGGDSEGAAFPFPRGGCFPTAIIYTTDFVKEVS